MRRLSILAALAAVLVVSAGTWAAPAQAAEGDPGDFCSYSPDYPFGWNFNGACRGHDECLDRLPADARLPDRLSCDDAFHGALLHASHLSLPGVCEDSAFCRLLATVYYRVVRTVTLLTGGAVDAPAPRASSG